MIVYGISTGSVHEGGGCGSTLYISFEEALKVAMIELEKEKAELEERKKADPDWVTWFGDRQWAQSNPLLENYWTDGYDYIWVQPFEVI